MVRKSNQTRSQNDIMSYLRRVGKSIKYASIDFVKEQLPISTSIITNNVETVKEAVSNVKNMRNDLKNSVQDSNLSYLLKAPEKLLDNAKKDLKSGEFHHPERAAEDEASLMDGMMKTLFGSDLADMLNGDFDEDEDEELDEEQYPVKGIPTITKGEATIAAITSLTSKKAANSISKAIVSMGEVNKRTLQNIATVQYQQTERQNVLLQHGFTGLSNGINSLIEFNNEIMRTHVENSKQFYESTSNILNENNAIFKELLDMQRYMYSGQKQKDEEENGENNNKKPVSANELFANGFDLKAYMTHIKRGAEKNPFVSMAMMLTQMIPMMISDVVNNPIEFLVKQGLGTLVNAPLRTAMKKLDATIGGTIKTGLARLADFGATDNSIVGQIARVFGFKQKETRLNEVDTSKYNKGAMSWNGVAQKTLVEVIPGYLRRIEGTLSGQGERIYDLNSGKWMTSKQVRNIAENDKRQRVKESTKEIRENLNRAFAPYSNKLSRTDLRQLNRYVDQFMTKIYDVGYIGNIDEMLSSTKGKDSFYGVPVQVARAILTAMKQMDSRVLHNVTSNVASSKAKFNEMIEGMAENGGQFGSNNVWSELMNNSSRGQVEAIKNIIDPETLKANPVLLQAFLSGKGVNPNSLSSSLINGLFGEELLTKNKSTNKPKKNKKLNVSVARAHQRSAFIQNQNTLSEIGAYSDLDINKALGGDSKELNELLKEVTTNLKEQNKLLKQQEIESNKSLFTNALDIVASDRKNLPEHIDPKAPLATQLVQAASIGEKFRVLSYNINKIIDSPSQILTGIISQADKFMYDLLFTKDTGVEKDKNGKEEQVHGFVGRMVYELKKTFGKANDWIDEKIKGSLTDKLASGTKTFAKDWLGVDIDDLSDRAKSKIHTIADPLTGGIKNTLKGIVSGASNDIKRTVSGVTDKAKNINSLTREDLLYAGDITEDDTVSSIIKRASKNRKQAEKEAKNAEAKFDNNQGQFAYGAKQVKRGGLAFISPGEAIIPADLNPWNPNRDKVDRKEQSKQEGRMKQRFSSALGRTLGKYVNTIPGKADGDTGQGFSFNDTNFSNYYPIFQFIQILRSQGIDSETIGNLLSMFGYDKTEADFFVELTSKLFGKALKFATGSDANSFTGEMVADFLTRSDFYRGLNDESKRMTRAILKKAGYKGFFNTEESLRKEEYNKGEGIFNGINQFTNAAFGTDMDLAGKKVTDFVKKNTPEIAGGGAVGALLSLVFPLGGPLMGAVAGAAANVIANNTSAMEYIFGKDIVDAAGNVRREEGIIPSKMVRALQKYIPDAKAFGLTGALAGLFTPFGPLGGMMLGVGASIAKNNAAINSVLFGEEGGLINRKRKELIKKAFPRITAATLSTLLLGPFGIMGNALLGSSLGLISTTDAFKNIMLGHKDSRGIRQGGLAGAIRREISDPLKRTMSDISDNLGVWFRDKIFKPIGNGLAPIGRAITSVTSTFTHWASNKIRNSIAGRFMDRLFGGALAGVRRAGGFAKWGAKKLGSGAAKIASGIETVGGWFDQDLVENGMADTMDLDTRVKIANKYNIRNKFTQADYALSQMNEDELKNIGDVFDLMYYTKEGGLKSYLKSRRGTLVADYQGDLEQLSRKQLDDKEEGALTQGRVRSLLRKIEKLNSLDDYEDLISSISKDNKLSSKTKKEVIKILNSRKKPLSNLFGKMDILKNPNFYNDTTRDLIKRLGLDPNISDKDLRKVIAMGHRSIPNQLNYIHDMYQAEYNSQMEGRLPGDISGHDAKVANLDSQQIPIPNKEEIEQYRLTLGMLNRMIAGVAFSRADNSYSVLDRTKMALSNPSVANDLAYYDHINRKGDLVSAYSTEQARKRQEKRDNILSKVAGDIYGVGNGTYIRNLSQERLDDVVFQKSNKNKAAYIVQGFRAVQKAGDKGGGEILDADSLTKLKDKKSIERVIFLTLHGYTIDPMFYQDIAKMPKESFYCVSELAKLGVRFDEFKTIASTVKDEKDIANDIIELAKVKLYKDSDETIGDRLTAGELAYKVGTVEFNMFKNKNKLNPTGNISQGIANAFNADHGNSKLISIGLDNYFSSEIDEENTMNKQELDKDYNPEKAFKESKEEAKDYNSYLSRSALSMKNLGEETDKLVSVLSNAVKALAKLGLEMPAKLVVGSDNVDTIKSMGRDISRSIKDYWNFDGENGDSNDLYINKLIETYGKYQGNKALNDLAYSFGDKIYKQLDETTQKILESVATKTGNKIEDMIIAAYINSGDKIEEIKEAANGLKDSVLGNDTETDKEKYKRRLKNLTIGNELYFDGETSEEKLSKFDDWFENVFWKYDEASKADVYEKIKKQANFKRAKNIKDGIYETETHAGGLLSATKEFILNDISSHIRGDSKSNYSNRQANDIEEAQRQSVPNAEITNIPSQGFANPNAINTAISTGNVLNGNSSGSAPLTSNEKSNEITNVPTADGDIFQYGKEKFGDGLVKLHNKENYEIDKKIKYKLELQERSTTALEVMADGFKYLGGKTIEKAKKTGGSLLDMFKDILKLPMELLSLPLKLLMMIPGVGALLRFGGRLFKFLMQYGINIFAQSNIGKSLAEIFSKFMGKNVVTEAIGEKLGLDVFTNMANNGAKTVTETVGKETVETVAKTATETIGKEAAGAAATVAGGAGLAALGKKLSDKVTTGEITITGDAEADKKAFSEKMRDAIKKEGKDLSKEEINKLIDSEWGKFSNSKFYTDASKAAKISGSPVTFGGELTKPPANAVEDATKPGIIRRSIDSIKNAGSKALKNIADTKAFNYVKNSKYGKRLLIAGSILGAGGGVMLATSGSSEAAVRQNEPEQQPLENQTTTIPTVPAATQQNTSNQDTSKWREYNQSQRFDPTAIEKELDGKFTQRAMGTLNSLVKNSGYTQERASAYARLLIATDIENHPNPEERIIFIPNSASDHAKDAIARKEIRGGDSVNFSDKTMYAGADTANYVANGAVNNAEYVANGAVNNANWLSKKGGQLVDYLTSVPGMIGAGTALASKFLGKRGIMTSSLLGSSAASVAEAIDNIQNNPEYGVTDFLGDTAGNIGTALGLGAGYKATKWLGKHLYRAANKKYIDRQIAKDVSKNGVEGAKSFGVNSVNGRSILDKIPIINTIKNTSLKDVSRTPMGRIKLAGLAAALGSGAYLANDYYNSINTKFNENQSALQGVAIAGSQFMPNVVQSIIGSVVGEKLLTAINPKLGNSKWSQLAGLAGGTVGGMITDESGLSLSNSLLSLLSGGLFGYATHQVMGTEADDIAKKYAEAGGSKASLKDNLKIRLQHAKWAAPLAALLLANKYGYTDEERENLYYQGQGEGNTIKSIGGALAGMVAGNAISNTFLKGKHKGLSRFLGGVIGSAGMNDQDLSAMSIMSGGAYTALPFLAAKLKDGINKYADEKSVARKIFDKENRILPNFVHSAIEKSKIGKWLPWVTTAGLGAGIINNASVSDEEKQARIDEIRKNDRSEYMGNDNKPEIVDNTDQQQTGEESQSKLGYMAGIIGSLAGSVIGQDAFAWLGNKVIKGDSKAARMARFMTATTGGVIGGNITDLGALASPGYLAASLVGNSILNGVTSLFGQKTTDSGMTGKVLDKVTEKITGKPTSTVENTSSNNIPTPEKETTETKPSSTTTTNTSKPTSSVSKEIDEKTKNSIKNVVYAIRKDEFKTKEEFDKWFEKDYWKNSVSVNENSPTDKTVNKTETKPSVSDKPTVSTTTTKPSILTSLKDKIKDFKMPSIGKKGKLAGLAALGTAIGAGTLLGTTQSTEASARTNFEYPSAATTETVDKTTELAKTGNNIAEKTEEENDNKGLIVDNDNPLSLAVSLAGSYVGGKIGEKVLGRFGKKAGWLGNNFGSAVGFEVNNPDEITPTTIAENMATDAIFQVAGKGVGALGRKLGILKPNEVVEDVAEEATSRTGILSRITDRAKNIKDTAINKITDVANNINDKRAKVVNDIVDKSKSLAHTASNTIIDKSKQLKAVTEGIVDKTTTAISKPVVSLAEKTKQIGSTAINTAREKGIEESAKLKSLLGEIKNGLQSVVSKLGKWISGKNAKAAVKGFVTKLLENITKPQNLAKAAKKVAAESAAAVVGSGTLGVGYMAFKVGEAIINFLSGYNGADEMLKLKPGTASTGMKIVSGLVTAICGCIPFIGAFIPSDSVLELAIEYVGPAFGFGKKELDELRRNADKKDKDEEKSTLSNSTEGDGFAKQLKDTAKGVVNSVINNAASMTGMIADKASKLYETAKNAAKGAYNWVKDTANAVGDWISTNASKGAEWLSNKASNAVNTAGEIVDRAGSAVSSGWNYIKNSSVGQTVSSIFGKGKETYDYLTETNEKFNSPSFERLMNFSNSFAPNFGMGGNFYSQLDPQYDMSMNVSGDQIPQSMRDSGCGPMSAANALSKLGIDIDPRAAAQYALDNGYKEKNGGIRPEYFKDMMSKFGVEADTMHDQASIKDSLRSGKPVILMGKDGRGETKYTPFAENPHYVTATGLDDNGNIVIQDPESNTPNQIYKASDVLNKSTVAVSASGMGKHFGRAIKSVFGKSKIIHTILSKFGRGGTVTPEKMWALANWASGKCQVDAKLIYAQWYHESGGFSSRLARENFNFGGMTQVEPTGDPSDKQPDGGNYYMHFANPEEWAEYYSWYINRCDGCAGCSDPVSFANALKSNGYFGDSVDNYVNGLNGGISAIPSGSPDMSLIDTNNFGKIDPGKPSKASSSSSNTGNSTNNDPLAKLKSGVKSFATIMATTFNPKRVSQPQYGTGKHFMNQSMFGRSKIPSAVSKITHSFGTGSKQNVSRYIANIGYVSGRSSNYGMGRDINQAGLTVNTGTDIPETIWNFLRGKGLSENTTAAIMGNIQAESSYNPSNINPKSGAKGICQWYKDRARALDSYAASKGGSWEDLNIQLNYLWDMEISPGKYYNQFLTKLDGLGSLDAAVEYWEQHFEVSGDTDSYPRRKAAAKEAFDKKGKGIKVDLTVSGNSSTKSNNGGLFGALDSIASGLSAALNPFASFNNQNSNQDQTNNKPANMVEKVQQTTDINRAAGNTGANPAAGEAAANMNAINVLIHGKDGIPIADGSHKGNDDRSLFQLLRDRIRFGTDENGNIYTEEQYNALHNSSGGEGKHPKFGMGKYGRGIFDDIASAGKSFLAAMAPDPKELQKQAEAKKESSSSTSTSSSSSDDASSSSVNQNTPAPNSEEANAKAAENPQNKQPTTQTTTSTNSGVFGKLESMATAMGQKVQSVMSKFGSKIMSSMPMFGNVLSTLFGDNNPILSIFGVGNNSSGNSNSNGTPSNLKNINMDIKGSTLETLMNAMPNEGITSPYMDEEGRPTPGAHGGIDIACSEGTEIPSPINGTVVDVGFEKGYGNYVQIKDSKGNFHIFGHLSKQIAQKGQQVNRGDIIALSGNTGTTSGPHLHYEIDPPENQAAIKDGAHLNPATYSAAGLGKHLISKFGMGKYGMGDIREDIDISSKNNTILLPNEPNYRRFNNDFGITDSQYKMAMFGRGATPYTRWNKKYGRGPAVLVNNHSASKLDDLLMKYSSKSYNVSNESAKSTNIRPMVSQPTTNNKEELNAILNALKENNELVKQNNQLLSAILQIAGKAISGGISIRQPSDTAMNTNSRQKGVNTAQSITDQLSIFGNGSKYGMGDRYGTDDSKGFESIINTIEMIASR